MLILIYLFWEIDDDGGETIWMILEVAADKLTSLFNLSTFLLFDSLEEMGKCAHFPFLMFSILKINSDHIIEKTNLISIFYVIKKLISNFY